MQAFDMPVQRKCQCECSGKKVAGYLCNFPKELVYAAGFLPFRLWGSPEDMREVDSYFPAFFCHFARSVFGLALRGEYTSLDALVTVNMDDTIYHLSNALKEAFRWPYCYLLNRPHDASTYGSFDFFLAELEAWKTSFEQAANKKITGYALSEAIALYNESRELLKQIYDLRSRFPAALSAVTVAEMVRASLTLPPQTVNACLRNIIGDVLRKNNIAVSEKKPRLHISGSIVGDHDLYQLIEDCGGIVVSDDLCQGARSFWYLVEETGNPLKDLARYYLEKMICPHMHTLGLLEKRLDFIMAFVERYRVDGVIFCLQKYCDCHQLDMPLLVRKLRGKGIPSLIIEIEGKIDKGQLGTRITAFLETIA